MQRGHLQLPVYKITGPNNTPCMHSDWTAIDNIQKIHNFGKVTVIFILCFAILRIYRLDKTKTLCTQHVIL